MTAWRMTGACVQRKSKLSSNIRADCSPPRNHYLGEPCTKNDAISPLIIEQIANCRCSANQVLAQKDEDNPRREGEADFFSRYALKWSPNDAEVAKIRAEIKAQIEALKKP